MKKICPSSAHACRINMMAAMKMSWFRIIIVARILFSTNISTADAETGSNLESRIKAAFLFNFCSFVTWPDTPSEKADAPIVFCVMGLDPFKGGLDTLVGKKIRGRPLEIRYISNSETIVPCHLLFIGKIHQKELAEIMAKVKSNPILTVGDMEDFAEHGGIITFVRIDNKIRFAINPTAAEAAGLKISSQLLKLAIINDKAHPKEK